MTIVDIIEIQNKFSKHMTPIKEKMDIYIPDTKNENFANGIRSQSTHAMVAFIPP